LAGRVDVVVIGLNEVENLDDCFQSIAASVLRPARVMYVDSGSTDGSVSRASIHEGVTVMRLAEGRAYPGAARNAGLAVCDAEYVHFLDGDMTLDPEWLQTALAELDQHPDVWCVIGRARQDRAQASMFDLVADVEYEMNPLGQVASPGCGGTFRRAELLSLGGYDGRLLRHEEPELGERIRRQGGVILSLADSMATHRVGMGSWSDLFRRSYHGGQGVVQMTRAGHPLKTWERVRPAVDAGVFTAGFALAWMTGSVGPAVFVGVLALLAVARQTARFAAKVSLPRALAAAILNYAGMPVVLAGTVVEGLRPSTLAAANSVEWITITGDTPVA